MGSAKGGRISDGSPRRDLAGAYQPEKGPQRSSGQRPVRTVEYFHTFLHSFTFVALDAKAS